VLAWKRNKAFVSTEKKEQKKSYAPINFLQLQLLKVTVNFFSSSTSQFKCRDSLIRYGGRKEGEATDAEVVAEEKDATASDDTSGHHQHGYSFIHKDFYFVNHAEPGYR
jgi:hypothetical protein